ncbi:thioredoxin [Sulfurisphaera ohwakuensis]|uniref:Thioredoxin n=1 Tax=Sulfurisphaera ohwakuensis TaxID=69656 RepID=A0A650CH58_SULOH|nr:thioredoxin [Sulfurisphaera ohwakuensis]MBB5252448.1 thioredoxin 1 [Sulfurisphaera ohwakuensis]QGR17099.1 thioredoxin [Sulfurisphaera ohwakuensis]
MSEIDTLVREIAKRLEEKAEKILKKEEATITITDSNIDDILTKNRVVFVDCWAPWCAPCHIYEPIFNKMAEKYKDKIVFGRLNVDENPKTADKYGVMNIPTTLIFLNGNLVDQIVGAVDETTLEEYIKKYLV